MSTISDTVDLLKREVAALREQVNAQEIRLTLAQAWINFYQYAYDALMHHGVNFKVLREYRDSTVLDDAQDMPLTEARNVITEYLGKVRNAIRAAVRRKGFKVHHNDED